MANNKTLNYFKSFEERIWDLQADGFEELALDIFRFQAKHNVIYKSFIEARGIIPERVDSLETIPFLPIEFFKSHAVICGNSNLFSNFYSSSGTTGMVSSRHYYWSKEFYLEHALRLFEAAYGSIKEFHFLALLPSYLERKGSSLVDMCEYFIQKTESPFSGFFLHDHQALIENIEAAIETNKKVILIGVTFALLDLAESGIEIPYSDRLIIMETGGMKGRRREMIREEVHQILKAAFGQTQIHSEYGMTELMSQAYSKGDGLFDLPTCMKVLIRDVNDPLSWSERSQGGINVIDLANFHSCSFIETQDLGKISVNGQLEVLGRFDHSDVRGCNLLVGG